MDKLIEFGITNPIFDNNIHRFDRGGKKNGWYIGFVNQKTNGDQYQIIQFGDWRTGEVYTESSSGDLSDDDFSFIEKRKKEIEFEKEILKNQTSVLATKIWESLKKTNIHDQHPYLVKKQIQPFGSRLSPKGELVISLHDENDVIWGLQYIDGRGQKLFLKNSTKKGNFYKLVKDFSRQNNDQIYITEGFATGASVAMATGAEVLVAFDAGNIKYVAQKFPEAIIAGDNDEAGIKACEGFRAIFPDQQGMDWNDVACDPDLGLESVRSQIQEKITRQQKQLLTGENQFADSQDSQSVPRETDQDLIKCLGYDGDTFFFLSKEKPQITKINASSFSKSMLFSMASMEYWEAKYPSKKGFDLDQAVNDLMRRCREAGYFQPENVRGSGVWEDHGKIVVNTGNQIVADGEIYDFSSFQSKKIYEQSKKITYKQTPKPKVDDFLLLLENLSFKQKDSAKLLFGWLAVAPICGMLPWRPHIWITGASGSGKTTVINDVVGKVIQAHRVTGRSTEAGIRQVIGATALPLIFDENETTDSASQKRVESVIELFRQSSSESESSVVKGTPSGKGFSYSVRFCACVSSINVGLYLEQDNNRFTVLELVKNDDNGFNERGGIKDMLHDLLTEDFRLGWLSHAVENAHKILEKKKEIYEALRKKTNARFAEQYGTMLAGYAVFMGFSVDQVLRDFTFSEYRTETEDQNEQDCLLYILGSKIIHNGQAYAVSNLIESALTDKDDVAFSNNVLQIYGMRVIDGMLAVSVKHTELSKLMKDSAHPRKWGASLARLEGSVKKNVRIAGVVRNCVCVDLVGSLEAWKKDKNQS